MKTTATKTTTAPATAPATLKDFVTINGNQYKLNNGSTDTNGLMLALMARSFQSFNGSKIVFDGISKEDAKMIEEKADDSIAWILEGIRSITNLVGFVDIDDTGTKDINILIWFVCGLTETVLLLRNEVYNLNSYANNKSL